MVLVMNRREMVSLPPAAAASVCCIEGSLWVTQLGDSRDYVLEAGMCLELAGHRPTLVQALGPARAQLQPVAPGTSQAGMAATRGRAAAWRGNAVAIAAAASPTPSEPRYSQA